MSEVKVNKISPRTACGTVTLGDSGDTFTIPAGATITNSGTAAGFGATGAASWDTTVKTTGFTAVSGVGYFVNTTGGAISVNLPAGTAGDVVAIKDYANTFDTNAVTLVRNGSDKVGGSTVNPTLATEGLAVTLVFVDSTQGWLVTDNGTQDTAPTTLYVTATGGTITCSGDYRIHTFTGPGTLCVSCAGNVSGSNSVDYLVVAGGGGGGGGEGIGDPSAITGGGAGAGGFRESSGGASGCYTASPLGACVSALPVSATGYPITVGGGGTAGTSGSKLGGTGANSIFSTIISTGGGGGGSNPAGNGGSGGGVRGACSSGTAGTGNTPPVSPPQGNPGGTNPVNSGPYNGSGGGGATAAGGQNAPSGTKGVGGAGATTSISATPTAYAGGGGGGSGYPGTTSGAGGTGGGGGGASPYNGTTNSGGGGAGGPASPSTGGVGGSGIVIIRYKFQN